MKADTFLPSDDLLAEQAYLVARGIRPLSPVGDCPAQPMVMLRVATQVERQTCPGAVPFVIDRGDETASFGYAAAAWAVDLFEWVRRVGYGAPAIARHDDEKSSRRFAGVTASAE